MDWIELSAAVAGDNVEALCAALESVVPGGCSIEEPIVPLGPEEGVRREPWRPSIVRVYVPADSQLADRRAIAEAVATLPFAVQLDSRRVREQDWANAWKDFFQVERIGRRFIVRPTWRTFTAGPDDVVLHLDPGMAFGTGQHETTRMCLVAIEELVREGMHVLDLGCGSGILTVAAACLGAARVDAVDIDSLAVAVTAQNAARNGVSARVRPGRGSLDEHWPFEQPWNAVYDVVVANIHAAAAVTLAPALRAAIRPGGAVVASGIIADRLDAVIRALTYSGFAPPEVRVLGEWRTVIAHASAGAGG